MQSVEEAQAVALGVNHIGITPSNLGLPGEVDFATARAIVDGGGKRPLFLSDSIYTIARVPRHDPSHPPQHL